MRAVPGRTINANRRATLSAMARSRSSASAPSATSDMLAAKKTMLNAPDHRVRDVEVGVRARSEQRDDQNREEGGRGQREHRGGVVLGKEAHETRAPQPCQHGGARRPVPAKVLRYRHSKQERVDGNQQEQHRERPREEDSVDGPERQQRRQRGQLEEAEHAVLDRHPRRTTNGGQGSVLQREPAPRDERDDIERAEPPVSEMKSNSFEILGATNTKARPPTSADARDEGIGTQQRRRRPALEAWQEPRDWR